jgi:UDP-N-acetylglucosamine acyltransferase
MHRLRRAYRLLFFIEGRLADRIEALAREFADDPWVGKIVAFVRAGGKRPLMRPRARRDAEAGTGDSDEAS